MSTVNTYVPDRTKILVLDKRRAYPIDGDGLTIRRARAINARPQSRNLWQSVRPKIRTAGIIPGMTIRTLTHGSVKVTAVGTLAGWGVDGHGNEVRWGAGSVTYVPPTID